MPEVRALLMDLDGTIADSHDLIFECLQYALDLRAGLTLEREVWEQRFIGMPLHEVYSAVFTEARRAAPENPLIDDLTHCYRSRQREMEASVRAYTGVIEALDTLRKEQIRLAVVTTKHEAATMRTLAHLGLADTFNAIVCGDHCENYKPHPQPFVTAMRQLGVSPTNCAGVGDSPLDVYGARAAGATTIAACWGSLNRTALLSAQPDHLAEQPSDIARILALKD